MTTSCKRLSSAQDPAVFQSSWVGGCLFVLLLCLSSCQPPPITKSVPPPETAVHQGRQDMSFNEGWRFYSGDIPFPPITMGGTYLSTKTGNASGAAAHRYDDSEWRTVTLPHDWVVAGAFDPKANGDQGYRHRGYGWYRRTFAIPEDYKGKHLELQFGGVATHCTVWVNGMEMQQNFGGYTGFSIDLTPIARFGSEVNTIAVRVDAEKIEGWWYEGGGIYRPVQLVVRPPVHIVTDGVWIRPTKIAEGRWEIPTEVVLTNSGSESASATVQVRLLEPDGQMVQSQQIPVQVAPLQQETARLNLTVARPKLWSVDDPQLYQVEARVILPDGSGDVTTEPCGFRTLRFDAQQGFFLNEKPLKIMGTCNHQDHLGVGVAVPDALWTYRIRRLKEMGSNAYRCSHHTVPRALLRECDRQGMLVLAETRIFSVAPKYVQQLEWMVRRDRNHPSIFLWSVFNEEPMQATEQGYEMVRRQVATVRRLDPTRPVTAAMSAGHFTKRNVSHAVDVVGFNYQHTAYDLFHELNPDKPMLSSEDTSAFMQRGEYLTDKTKNLIASYDDDSSEWGATHATAWKAINTRPFIAGAFVWTGFDYRGEPAPYKWPSASSFFGCMDMGGFPKAAYYLRQAMWIKDRPILHLIPHWNWKGREGQPVRVKVITNAPQAELYLNGTSLGTKAVDPYTMADWQVPYQPGTLEVVARQEGREVAREKVETTGSATRLELMPDRPELAANGLDTIPVTVRAVDAAGRVVPEAAPMVQFSVSGSLRLLGEGNGDPNNHELEQDGRHTLFHGLGQIIVQAGHEPGAAVLRAESPGLTAAEITLPLRSVPPVPSLPAVPFIATIIEWKKSPLFADYPDATAKAPIALGGPQNWRWVPLPATVQADKAGWYQWRAFFRSFTREQIEKGGVFHFASITGRGEFWLNNKKVAEKTDPAAASVSVVFGPSKEEHRLVVLLHAEPGESVGLTGLVKVNRLTP